METDKNEDDEKKKKGNFRHTHMHARNEHTHVGFPCFLGHSIDIMIFKLYKQL